MITTDELVELTEVQDQQNHFKLGAVVGLFGDGTAKVQFDGEETPSEKQYAYLDSYIPEAGDRVLFGVLGGTYVILGKVNYNVSPSIEEIDRYLFDLKKAIMQKGLKVSLGIETDTLTVNNGATIVGNVGVSGKVTATGISSSGAVTGSSLDVTGQVKGQSLSITNAITAAGLTSSGTVNANGTFLHRGSYLSFFNKNVSVARRSVRTLEGTPTVETLRAKLNELIQALQDYGLIN